MISIKTKDWNKFEAVCKTLSDNYKDFEFEMRVISPTEYAVYQEFGTYKMSAQPYFIDNFQQGADKIQDALNDPDVTVNEVKQIVRDIVPKMKQDAPKDTGRLESEITVEE